MNWNAGLTTYLGPGTGNFDCVDACGSGDSRTRRSICDYLTRNGPTRRRLKSPTANEKTLLHGQLGVFFRSIDFHALNTHVLG